MPLRRAIRPARGNGNAYRPGRRCALGASGRAPPACELEKAFGHPQEYVIHFLMRPMTTSSRRNELAVEQMKDKGCGGTFSYHE